MSPEAFDFLNRLLCVNPKERLGSNGIAEVKEHPFFADIVWTKLMDMPAPFIPGGLDNDTSYFPKSND